MHCHLLVPDFFRFPRDAQGGADSDASARSEEETRRLPAAETLLARGRRSRDEAPETWLYRQFGVEKQRDWPDAPYSLLADGGAPGPHYWMRADPVHLRVDRDRLILADPGVFSLSRAEADALVQTLNAHFGDEVVFEAAQPQRWYVRFPRTPETETTPLASVRGGSIDPALPRGTDAMRLHALMNEVQMLLFEHPVNTAREARGEEPVNSVWLWGAGCLPEHAPERAPAHFSLALADDPLARGLAQAAGVPARALPTDAKRWLEGAPDEGLALIVLDALRDRAAYGDAGAFFERRIALETHWFAPLLEALRRQRIGMVTLHLGGANAMLNAETVRSDLHYFWRRRKPLAAYRAAGGES